MKKLIYGVGYNSQKLQVRFGNKTHPYYETWRGVLRRCYDEAAKLRNPTYINATVEEYLWDYSNFYNWVDNLEYREEGWQLDKDLLIKGNKHYSRDTCVFLPQNINKLLTKRQAKRGDLPIGVHYNKRDNLYQVSCNDIDGRLWHSYCKSVDEAFVRYKEKKESVIKYWAEQYKGRIDPRAYDAMLSYVVEIND